MEVTGDKAGGQSELPGDRDKQLGEIAAGAGAPGECRGRGLDPGLFTHPVCHGLVDERGEAAQQAIALDRFTRPPDAADQAFQFRCRLLVR